MTIQEELAKASPAKGTVLTIGTFDSVHLGHQHLLQRLKQLAASNGLLSVALTFRNHPRAVLKPEIKLPYITTLDERVALLKAQGIDLVIGVDFTRELSLLKAGQFVSLLVDHLKLKGLVVGPDFALGHQREGDIPTLQRLGAEMGFWVEPVEPALMDQSTVKSSRVRSLISQGDVNAARRLLGRPYALTGVVVEGERRGRLLGFPTANLSWSADLIIPTDGIYATWAVIGGRRHQSATNVGVRPTFGESPRIIEAFILDFEEDIYGKPLTLEFAARLRDERAFPSAEALVEQMKLDVEQARAALSDSPKILSS